MTEFKLPEPVRNALDAPVRVRMVTPHAPAAPSWAESTKHLREIARWITGGVIATAAAVATGSSLTGMGKLDPQADPGRLALVVLGLLIALAAIWRLMRAALGVLNIDTASLDEVAVAAPGAPFSRLRARLERLNKIKPDQVEIQAGEYHWVDILGVEGDPAQPGQPMLIAEIEAAMPFDHVRERFDQLVAALPGCVGAAFGGLLLFAWAANPPDRPATPERGITVKIIQ